MNDKKIKEIENKLIPVLQKELLELQKYKEDIFNKMVGVTDYMKGKS